MPTSTIDRPSTAVVAGLSPYSGPWGREQAAHLLRRTLFGPKKSEIITAIDAGLSATLDQLLAPSTLPTPPVNHYFPNDPNVPIGASWVDAPHVEGADVGQYRWPSLRGWYFHNVIHSEYNIMERMAMFWFNHFGMADVGEHRAQYQYIQLFREKGTGNFQRMIEEITVHPAMLRFLNGEYNNKWNPNENFARELLELFTIQKGPQVPGDEEDYTNYTEEDIRVGARILTGWQNRGMWSQQNTPVESVFNANAHDNSDDPPKQLSHRFNNVVIESNGAEEYKDFIAVIFQQPETARAFCRELYRYFVYYDITPAVEVDVIQPLAQVLIDNDFEIKPTLRVLLSSDHFYEMSVRGPLIKSPYDFYFSVARTLGGYTHLGMDLSDNTASNPNLQITYNLGSSLHWWATTMDMDFLYPPTVAGWKAYYQTPGFYRNWIGSATLQRRRKLIENLTGSGIWSRDAGHPDTNPGYSPRPFDYFGFVAALEVPFDANELVAESAQIFLPRPLHPDQLDGLKAELLGTLPDMEWSRQYADYRSSPNNPDVAGPVLDRLKRFFRALFSMAEFHLQ